METESLTDGESAGRGEGDPRPSEAPIDAVDRVLGEVERALSRLDDGTYGRCATCGAAIDDARLAEWPTTESCGACALPGAS